MHVYVCLNKNENEIEETSKIGWIDFEYVACPYRYSRITFV